MEGREVGPYTLVERLGGGGMGEVWRARHAMLGRSAAVKLIAPSPGSDRDLLLDCLGREARATSMLQSLHTVQVWDFGVTDDGAFWAAMELLDGLDLRDLVEQHGPVPPGRARSILLQVCESLAEAHSLGLVHRDIKPANLMVCRHGLKVDVAKVLDFGLVKAASDPELLPGPRLTASHAMVGSPAFMAPEALTSDAEVDSRVDQYGLGCVAVWLLTGQLVFDHTHAMDMMLAHRAEAPQAPSKRGVDGIPEAFDAVVLRCLAKDPAERFADMAALAEALRDVPVQAPWTEPRAREWWSRHHEPRWQRSTPLPAPAMTWSEGRMGPRAVAPSASEAAGSGAGGEGRSVIGAIPARHTSAQRTLELSGPTLATASGLDADVVSDEPDGPSWTAVPPSSSAAETDTDNGAETEGDGEAEDDAIAASPSSPPWGWLGLGAAALLIVGAGAWFVWPAQDPPPVPPQSLDGPMTTQAEDPAEPDPPPVPSPSAARAAEADSPAATTAEQPTDAGRAEPTPVQSRPQTAPVRPERAFPPAAPSEPTRDDEEAGTADDPVEPSTPPEPASCSLSGEFTDVTLRGADGTVQRCSGELAPGRYEVFGDFAGEGPESGGLELDVEPGGRVVISCNRVDWSCTAR